MKKIQIDFISVLLYVAVLFQIVGQFYIVNYILVMRILYTNGCSRHEAGKQWGQDLHVMLESPQGLVQSVGLEMAAARRPDHLSHTTFEMSIKTSKINTDTVKEERSRR